MTLTDIKEYLQHKAEDALGGLFQLDGFSRCVINM